MATASLNASPRSDTGKGVARALRREGRIPAVIYGHGRSPQPLAIDARELTRILERVSAETTVFELALDGTVARTLIREIQRHPVKRDILHIDFQELVAGEKVTVKIPIVLVGTPEGVRAGGVLDQLVRELEATVDPANIPSHIDIDVSALTIGHSLHVGELAVPAGVELVDDAEKAVATITAPRAQAEPTAAAEGAEAPAEPEVIRSKKTDEEGE